MPLESFSERNIEVAITLRTGNFNSGGNRKIIKGLATSVTITKPMLPAKHEAAIDIYGLKQEDIEQLTTLSPYSDLQLVPGNFVEVYADSSLAFKGSIISAVADYNSAPDIPMEIKAVTGFYEACMPKPVYSYKGNYSIVAIFNQLATDMSKTLVNRGVSGTVRDLALSGDPWSKAVRLAKDQGISLIIDGDEMVIAPQGVVRDDQIPLWTKTSGMIGFPRFTNTGVTIRHLYDQRVRLGSKVKVETLVPKANGIWTIIKLTHHLDARIPNGEWYTEAECVNGIRLSGIV